MEHLNLYEVGSNEFQTRWREGGKVDLILLGKGPSVGEKTKRVVTSLYPYLEPSIGIHRLNYYSHEISNRSTELLGRFAKAWEEHFASFRNGEPIKDFVFSRMKVIVQSSEEEVISRAVYELAFMYFYTEYFYKGDFDKALRKAGFFARFLADGMENDRNKSSDKVGETDIDDWYFWYRLLLKADLIAEGGMLPRRLNSRR